MVDLNSNAIQRTSLLLLRNIAKLSSIVSRSELEIVIHAFISPHLYHCNIKCMQVVQNAAARLRSAHTITNSLALAPH